jgi:hypothetical protein
MDLISYHRNCEIGRIAGGINTFLSLNSYEIFHTVQFCPPALPAKGANAGLGRAEGMY